LAVSDPRLVPASRSAGRAFRRGFTLLETLIAFSIVALIVGGLAGLFAWATAQQDSRLRRLLLAEFAVSVLEEHVATYPLMPISDTAPGGWSWAIAEEKVVPDQVTALQTQITYLQLTARVWQDAKPDLTMTASTLLAIRTSP
jgi:prepilin-type N-terminal cleavage/methylation domain-containing protein